MIKFQCKCGKQIQVKNELSGKRGKCPQCGESIQVPRPKQIRDNIEDDATPQQHTSLQINHKRTTKDKFMIVVTWDSPLFTQDIVAAAAQVWFDDFATKDVPHLQIPRVNAYPVTKGGVTGLALIVNVNCNAADDKKIVNGVREQLTLWLKAELGNLNRENNQTQNTNTQPVLGEHRNKSKKSKTKTVVSVSKSPKRHATEATKPKGDNELSEQEIEAKALTAIERLQKIITKYSKSRIDKKQKILLDKQKLLLFQAANALSKIGTPSIPFFKDLLEHKDENIHHLAIHSLGKIGSPCSHRLFG